MNIIKEESCTGIFTGPTGCGKTQRVLELIKNEYKNHFENIVILCPTLKWNRTYLNCEFLWKDDSIFFIESGDQLFEWIEKFSNLFAGETTLFVVDDMIADEKLDKERQALLDLAISGTSQRSFIVVAHPSVCCYT